MGTACLPLGGLALDPPCVVTGKRGLSPESPPPAPPSRTGPGRSWLPTWGHGGQCLARVCVCRWGYLTPASPACRSAWAPQLRAWAREASSVSQGPPNFLVAPQSGHPAGWAAVSCSCCPRLAELAGRLGQEKQFREAACSALQKSQEDAGQRLDREVAKMQVPGGRPGLGSWASRPSRPRGWAWGGG